MGFAFSKVSSEYIELGWRISLATPTSVEIIGVLVTAHSKTAWGPPSSLEETKYKSNIL